MSEELAIPEEGPEIQLATGQMARMSEGRVHIVPHAEHHYKLVAEHKTTGELQACCGDYDGLIIFLKQLEKLDYRLRCLERMPGEVPSVKFAN